mmetsp:Transcript_103290/g.205297  ORF Transcript_103290/g.205297 Transcript_103290/m.205297 type:complete len:240 (-) Transcript_103290:228-947(-)
MSSLHLTNVDAEDRRRSPSPNVHEEPELEERTDDTSCRSFFELRQRILAGMDQVSAFRIVALGLLRKLHPSVARTVLYVEVEDALNRYLRIVDLDLQKFVSLHDIFRTAAEKQETDAKAVAKDCKDGGSAAVAASTAATSLLNEGMHEIAAVLLACSQMQKRALDLKVGAQRTISESDGTGPPLVSFTKIVEFLQEAIAVCDQLRKKHEELQQTRIRAMATFAEAKARVGSNGNALASK